jgi:hypothetical protein
MAKSTKLVMSDQKKLVGFQDHPLAEALGPAGVVTFKMYERLASHEGRRKDTTGVIELMSDTLNCYLKQNYPHFELEYQENAAGLTSHKGLIADTDKELSAAEQPKALPKKRGKRKK